MAENTLEKSGENISINETSTTDGASSVSQQQQAAALPAGKRKLKGLVVFLSVILSLAVIAGGGFFSVRLYESQSLNQAKSHLQQGNWAAAEAAANQALSLQQTGLLASPVDLIMTRGEAYYQQGKYDQASADFEVVKTARPSEAAPYLYQSKMLYTQGKFEEALSAGKEALKRDENLAFPYTLQALQAYQKNQFVDALNHAEAALQRDPQEGLAYRVRGSVQAWQYDLDAAQKDLSRANELLPENPETLTMQAYIHFLRHEDVELEASVKAAEAAGKDSAPALWAQAMLDLAHYDDDAASKAIDQAIKLDGSRPEYYYFRTLTYYKTEQEKQGLADLEKAISLNPDFVPAIVSRVRYLFERYEAVDVEAEAQRILELAPQANLPHLLLADKYTREHEWEKALEEAELAVKAQPEPSLGLMARADIYLEQRDYEKAAADLQEAIKIQPNRVDGLLGLAGLQLAQSKYDEAIKSLEQAEKIYPESMSVHGARALVYLSQDNTSKARAEVDAALKRDSGNSDILVTRALVSQQKGDYLNALSDLNRVGELYPKDPRIMVLRAGVLASNNDLTAALAELAKAEKIDSKLVNLYATKAMIYMAQNDAVKALPPAQKAVDLDPKNGEANSLLGQAELQKGKIKEGIQHLKLGLELEPDQRSAHYVLGIALWNEGDVEGALENLKKISSMKGRMDPQQVSDARQMVSFLEKVPPLVNGLRTVTDTMKDYTIAYSAAWVPRPPFDDGSLGMQFLLTGKDLKKTSIFQVQIVRLVDLNVHSLVSPELMSSALMQYLPRACLEFKKVSHESFQGKDTHGVTDTFDCTQQSENQGYLTVRQKLYVFTSDESYAALLLSGVPDQFDKDLKAADEVAATFAFVKD